MSEGAKQWSGAVLAIAAIVALTILGINHVVSGDGVGYSIVALGMRAGGLLTHGIGLASAKSVDSDGGK